MEYEKVKEKFGSWAPHLKDFINTAEFDNIFKTLKALTKRGRTVCPIKEQTFRCFELTPYENLKAVFVFGSPYETKSGNDLYADGLALSAGNVSEITTGIRHFFNGIYQDFPGVELDCDIEPDLSYLASQGILMLNVALTTELYKYGSHVELWRPFMNYFFTEVISRYKKSLPIVFFGEHAKAYYPFVMPFNHRTFTINDPLRLAETEQWSHQAVFKHVDRIVRENNEEFNLSWKPCLMTA